MKNKSKSVSKENKVGKGSRNRSASKKYWNAPYWENLKLKQSNQPKTQ